MRALVARHMCESDGLLNFDALSPAGRTILDEVQQGEGVPLGGAGYAEEDLRAALISVINATRDNLLAPGPMPEPQLVASA